MFTINPDGTDEKQITARPPGTVDDQPDWSPDGKPHRVRALLEEQPCSVWTVNADGGRTPRRCASTASLEPICDATAPAWAPNGRSSSSRRRTRPRAQSHGEFHQIERFSVELIDLAAPDAADDRRPRPTGPATLTSRRSHPTAARSSTCTGTRGRPKPANGQRAVRGRHPTVDHHRRLTPWKLGAGDHPVFSTDGKQVLFRSFWEEDEQAVGLLDRGSRHAQAHPADALQAGHDSSSRAPTRLTASGSSTRPTASTARPTCS